MGGKPASVRAEGPDKNSSAIASKDVAGAFLEGETTAGRGNAAMVGTVGVETGVLGGGGLAAVVVDSGTGRSESSTAGGGEASG